MHSPIDQMIQPKETHAHSLLTQANSPVTTVCTTPFSMQASSNKREDEAWVTGTARKQQSTTSTLERKKELC